MFPSWNLMCVELISYAPHLQIPVILELITEDWAIDM